MTFDAESNNLDRPLLIALATNIVKPIKITRVTARGILCGRIWLAAGRNTSTPKSQIRKATKRFVTTFGKYSLETDWSSSLASFSLIVVFLLY
jgi:hypothetical protein